MPCISKDGASYFFRLMDRIKPRLTDLAIALDFPVYVIDILETKPNPVYYLLSEWLKGRNQEYDSRPLTWATLITALQHAGLLEEVKILEQHCLATRTSLATVLSQTSTCKWVCVFVLTLIVTTAQNLCGHVYSVCRPNVSVNTPIQSVTQTTTHAQ